jgi:ankyrin repeat protein
VEAVDGWGLTALHRAAAACGDYEHDDRDPEAAVALSELLLQRGARVDARDRGGETPLHGAAGCWYFAAMRLLLDHGAEVDARGVRGRTPLMALFEATGDFEGLSAADGIQLLAGRGADANAVDDDGRSPLSFASGHGDTDADAVRALLAAGARLERENGPQLIEELLAPAAHAPPGAALARKTMGAIHALLDAGTAVSLRNVRTLAEAAAGFLVNEPDAEDAEALVGAIPRVLAAVERALDEDVDARVAARLAAAVEADRRDVASGLRALITGAAAEARRLEAARAALAQAEQAAAAPSSSGGDEPKALVKRARRG